MNPTLNPVPVFSLILIKSEMFVLFFILQISCVSAFDVHCENHCACNFWNCLKDCGEKQTVHENPIIRKNLKHLIFC